MGMADYTLRHSEVTEKRNSTLKKSLVFLFSDRFSSPVIDLLGIELVELFELSVIRHILPSSPSHYSKKRWKCFLNR